MILLEIAAALFILPWALLALAGIVYVVGYAALLLLWMPCAFILWILSFFIPAIDRWADAGRSPRLRAWPSQ